MKIKEIKLRRLELLMREPFVTSFGSEIDKDVIIVELTTESGAKGYGECVASTAPLYSEETNGTAWHMIRDFFGPLVKTLEFNSKDDLQQVRTTLTPFKMNRMAKAAVEMAVWDAFANETQTPLVNLLGGVKREIPVGISIGIQASTEALVEKVAGYVAQGFQRMKVKIKPGVDYAPLAAIRDKFPEIPLMADANSAYRLTDVDRLQELDNLNLMMIEQPLSHDDIVHHARLAKSIRTPICLDESIHSADDAEKAIELGAAKIVNLKLGRVGGFAEALLIHDVCQRHGIGLWCGGMLETGIGRLHNVAITSLSGFTLPGDTAPSARYFEEDIIDPAVEFRRPGYLAVEKLCGVASRVVESRLDKWTKESICL